MTDTTDKLGRPILIGDMIVFPDNFFTSLNAGVVIEKDTVKLSIIRSSSHDDCDTITSFDPAQCMVISEQMTFNYNNYPELYV